MTRSRSHRSWPRRIGLTGHESLPDRNQPLIARESHAWAVPRLRPTILVFTQFYLPGYKAGGPAKSLRNMVEALGAEFSFRIVTSDRDGGDRKPYSEVPIHGWTKVGSAQVYYAAPGPLRFWRTAALLRHGSPDVVYLNSFFGRGFSMWPLLLWRLGLTRAALLLAPRGEFSPAALAIKRLRKRAYVWVAERLGLYRGVQWHVSSPSESLDLDGVFGRAAVRHLAAPLAEVQRARPADSDAAGERRTRRRMRSKQPGTLRIAFVSRIVRMKNLGYALNVLMDVCGQVRLDIYGPLEDDTYWRECQELIARLPPSVTVEYHGPAHPGEVKEVFAQAELFLFPTLGENFGHVVTEALAQGCPVLLSDRTPWNDVEEAGAGWALPLSDIAAFRAAVERCVGLDSKAFEALAAGAFRYAEGVAAAGVSVLEQNRAMLDQAARGAVP
jgi:glycosyltransferase involved in cell wall biosynthesis